VQKLQPKRLEQLDSLRGIAAFTVLVGHFLLLFPAFWIATTTFSKQNWFIYLITFTPLHIFWCGTEAVVFFFVLSGFVLALPFFDSTKTVSYTFFLIKRIFRLYPPYLSAVILAVLVNVFLFRRGGCSGLSDCIKDYLHSFASVGHFHSIPTPHPGVQTVLENDTNTLGNVPPDKT
jgi:peptidoglycan/LPS O-acetylase OafA/YrhL